MMFLGINASSSVHQHRVSKTALIAVLHVADSLALHAKRLRRRVLLPFVLRPMLDRSELTCLRPPVELLPDLREVHLTHAPVERSRQNRPSALDRRTLEEMFAGVGHGYLSGLARMGFVILSMLPCFGDNAVGLVAVLR